MRLRTRQRGSLLLIAVAMIVGVSFLALVLVSLFTGDTLSSVDHNASARALFLADSGAEAGTRALLAPQLAQRLACGANIAANPNFTNAVLGTGRFTLTWAGPGYATAARVQGALAAAVTTILVNNTVGYANSGRILIDREAIDYNGITANSFLNAVRGAGGSVASAHGNNAPVGQYQCAMTSVGGVPDLVAANSSLRTLTEGVQLQEGWAVGLSINATPTGWRFARWNPVAATNAWQLPVVTTAAVNAVQLNSVSLPSYADGWAVGTVLGATGGATTQRWAVLRWNGAAWTRFVVNTNPVVATALNSVFTTSSTDGWAVGTVLGATGGATTQRWAVLRWNGAAWTRFVVNTNPVVATTLNSVFTLDTDNNGIADNGWAVGNVLGATGGATTQRWAVLLWNGAAWTRFVVNTNPVVATTLTSVTMTSPTDGWAVGNVLGATGGATTQRWAVLRWNGATWTRFVVNTNPVVATTLTSVTMTSPTDGWAVGNVLGATGGPLTQRWAVLRWNGATWTRFVVNTPGLNATTLNSVSCLTANDCWAVGNTGTRLQWNGTVWTAVTAPAIAQNLRSVSMVGARQRPRAMWQELFP